MNNFKTPVESLVGSSNYRIYEAQCVMLPLPVFLNPRLITAILPWTDFVVENIIDLFLLVACSN